MKESDFRGQFPGTLVPTAFTERQEGGERVIRGIAFVPEALPPELGREHLIGRLFEVLDRAKTSLLELQAEAESLPDPNVLLSAMRVREVQSSSKIENTFSSLKDIAISEVLGAKADQDSQEVLRNKQAVEHGLTSALPLSNRLINEMHRKLIIDPRHTPGKLRQKQVCIGDENHGFAAARFVPPPAEHVSGCMKDWEHFVNPESIGAPKRARFPFFIELALAHYQFEAIHPYSDGNGRLGRAIVNIAPIKAGVLRQPVCNLSEWVQTHRDEYYDRLLRVSTMGEWEPWIRFFCTALGEQALLDRQRAGRIRALYEKYRAMVQNKQRSALAGRLVDYLFSDFVVTIPRAQELLGISYTAAQRHIAHLIKQGILTQANKGNYDKIYIANAILKAVRGKAED
ncbi:MAG: Fic family protein [Phycisphaeraceae bacterium]|nr:Fic family protein [Phycisphaeraceae bacterium]